MNKTRLIYDKHIDPRSLRQSSILRGRLRAYDPETKKMLWEDWNKVIVDGSMYVAARLLGIDPPVTLPTYDIELGLDNCAALSPVERMSSQVCLFCMGTSGCGPENSQVYDVDYTKWIRPQDMVPFRYRFRDNDISNTLRQKYFGRKEISAANRIAYYFKAADTRPALNAQYIDGTPISEYIYESDNSLDCEVFAELKLSITKEDCREWFMATSGINDTRVNTISLLVGYPKEIGGFTYYQGVRPLTRFNFSNESLIDQTKGIDITYDLFF